MGPKQSAFVDPALVSSPAAVGRFHVPLYGNLVLIKIVPTLPGLRMQPALLPSQQVGILLPGCVSCGSCKAFKGSKLRASSEYSSNLETHSKRQAAGLSCILFVCLLTYIVLFLLFVSFNKFWTPTQSPNIHLFFELFLLKLGWGA